MSSFINYKNYFTLIIIAYGFNPVNLAPDKSGIREIGRIFKSLGDQIKNY